MKQEETPVNGDAEMKETAVAGLSEVCPTSILKPMASNLYAPLELCQICSRELKPVTACIANMITLQSFNDLM